MERLKINPNEVQTASLTNYKRPNAILFEKLKISLRNFGQLKPVNCFKKDNVYYCFEGKQVLKAMIELNFDEIEINLHDVSEEDKRYIQLLLNDLNFKSCDFDLSKILSSFIRIKKSFIPYDGVDTDSLIALNNFDWDEFSRKGEDTQVDLMNFLNQ